MKLICLPYAGGSSMVYTRWKCLEKENVQVIALEYAGRGTRSTQEFYTSIYDAVQDLYSQVKNQLENEDVILFGYSLGARLAYELAIKIKENQKGCRIRHIIFAACDAPSIVETRMYSKYDDEKLVETILGLGGSPIEIFENKSMREYFLRIIRADFMLAESYRNNGCEKVDCAISVIYGSEDAEIAHEYLSEWSKFTSGNVSFYEFAGGHFFINKFQETIIRMVARTIKKMM